MKPAVSVIIPALNEEKYIGKTLQALKNQDIKLSFEIIVVDSESKDKTAKIAQDFGARVLRVKKVNPAFARQKGIEASRAEIVACIDADTTPSSSWIKNICKAFKDPELVGLTGLVFPLERNLLTALFWQKIPQTVGFSFHFFIGKPIFQGQNFAVKKNGFFKIGGFNQKLYAGEDMDLGLRLKKLGKVAFAPQVVVFSSSRRFSKGHLKPFLRFLVVYLHVVWKFPFLKKYELEPFSAIR